MQATLRGASLATAERNASRRAGVWRIGCLKSVGLDEAFVMHG
jgi:hypothetical protein